MRSRSTMLVYILGLFASGGLWLFSFLRDKETPKTDVASWVLLCFASICWPIAVPLACLELLGEPKVETLQENTLLN